MIYIKKKCISLIACLTIVSMLNGCDLITGPSANVEKKNISEKNKQDVKSVEKKSKVENHKKNKELIKNKIKGISVRQQEVQLNEILKKNLNTFFNSFLETNVKEFKKENASINFAQITRLLDNTDSTYTVFVNVYTAPVTFKDVYGDIKENTTVKLKGQIKAMIKKTTQEGKKTYVLLNYDKIN